MKNIPDSDEKQVLSNRKIFQLNQVEHGKISANMNTITATVSIQKQPFFLSNRSFSTSKAFYILIQWFNNESCIKPIKIREMN